MGVAEKGGPHYYRVQGPRFAIEYDNTQNNNNHIHAVWRDYDGDFGRDILAEHYKAEHGSAAPGAASRAASVAARHDGPAARERAGPLSVRGGRPAAAFVQSSVRIDRLRNSARIGGPVWSCRPMKPLLGRFALSPSRNTALTLPLIACTTRSPRAMMWMVFQPPTLMAALSASAGVGVPKIRGLSPRLDVAWPGQRQEAAAALLVELTGPLVGEVDVGLVALEHERPDVRRALAPGTGRRCCRR